MAHEIENDTAFYSYRKPAWHGLGYVSEIAMTIDEALIVADMDFTWAKHPISTTVLDENGVETLDLPEKFANVRTNLRTGERTAFGPVGKQYTNHTLREIWDFVDALQGGGAQIETLGSLGRGERAFITLLLPNTVKVGGKDVTDMYLSTTTAFDGSQSTATDVTGVRVVCGNTWRASKLVAVASAKIRHTSALSTSAADKAKRLLDLTVEYTESLETIGNQLLSTPLRSTDAAQVIATLFPFPESIPANAKYADLSTGQKRSITTVQAARGKVQSLYTSSPVRAADNTAWGLFNAVTEYADWFSPVRTSDGNADTIRSEKVLLGQTEAIKDQALSLLLV